MHADASGFASGKCAGHDRASRVDDHFGIDIGGDAAHGIMRGGLHRHGFMHGVDAQVGAAEIENIGQFALDCGIVDEVGAVAAFFGEVAVHGLRAHIKVNIAAVLDAAASAGLEVDGAADHIAGGQVLGAGGIAFHEAFADAVDEHAALAAYALGDEDAHAVDAGGVELEELHILQGHATPQCDRRAIAGQGMRIARD